MSHLLDISIDGMRFPGADRDLIGPLEFQLSDGEFVSLLGPSGSGKTTLLRIIAALERSFRGRVSLKASVVAHPSRRVQMLFQDNRLFPWMSARRNVEFAHAGKLAADRRRGARRLLDQFGLISREAAWPRQLSGGEQSRVALARSLAALPELLLLDEPFKNLDIAARAHASYQLSSVLSGTGIGVIMVSHDADEALLLSDRILILSANPLAIKDDLAVPCGHPRELANATMGQLRDRVNKLLLESDSA